MIYNFVLSYEDGVWIIISFDYKIIIEEKNKEKVVKKAEKVLKQKLKKEGAVHPVSECQILKDLTDVDNIYELIQITVWISL